MTTGNLGGGWCTHCYTFTKSDAAGRLDSHMLRGYVCPGSHQTGFGTVPTDTPPCDRPPCDRPMPQNSVITLPGAHALWTALLRKREEVSQLRARVEALEAIIEGRGKQPDPAEVARAMANGGGWRCVVATPGGGVMWHEKPISGNIAHFAGSTSRRRPRVRGAGEGGHLRLVRATEQEPAALAPAPYHPPVRAGVPSRPEWLIGLPPTLVDLPDPSRAPDHLEAAIDLLRRAAQSSSVSERGDAILVAVEHASRSFGELFDRETAKKLLRDIADGL